MSEAAKIRSVVFPLMENKSVLDIGCGDEKIVPWAVGVDSGIEWDRTPKGADFILPVDPEHGKDLLAGLQGKGQPVLYDVVFSSHTLEHIRSPILETLRFWLSMVKPGGKLALYLPDETYYIYDSGNRTARNPAHVHYLTLQTFVWYLWQLKEVVVDSLKLDVGPDRYSFLAVLSKKS